MSRLSTRPDLHVLFELMDLDMIEDLNLLVQAELLRTESRNEIVENESVQSELLRTESRNEIVENEMAELNDENDALWYFPT